MDSKLPAGILIIENPEKEQDIILKLESLQEANSNIKRSIKLCSKRLEDIKKIMKDI